MRHLIEFVTIIQTILLKSTCQFLVRNVDLIDRAFLLTKWKKSGK